MKHELFIDQKDKTCFYVGNPQCGLKGCELPEHCFFVIYHPKTKPSYGKPYCHVCIEKLQTSDLLVGSEVRRVLVRKVPPETAIPVVIRRFNMKNSNTDVFSAATSNRGISADCDSSTINDHTVLSGRESLEGASIGLDPENVDSKDNVLSDDEVDNFLLGVQNSEPCLPNSKKVKRLESKEDVL